MPLGIVAYARFLHANMRAGTPWSAIWYFRGAEFARTEDIWVRRQSRLQKRSALVRLVVCSRANIGLSFILTARFPPHRTFTLRAARAHPYPASLPTCDLPTRGSPDEAPLVPAASSFPNSIASLYAIFDWQRIENGTPWTLRWLVDEQAFFRSSYRWSGTESGSDFLVAISNPPEGSYTMELLVNNLLLADASMTIGIGQLPIDRFAQFDGTVLSGTVIDAATQNGLPNITVVLISEDYAASEFEWIQEQVVDLATSDRNGDFQFARPLSFDTPYSVVIEADGYIPHAADGFSFDQSQPNAEITIEMVRG